MTELRLMAVHAHPDDESSKGAATMARYVDEGHRVLVVTLTGGERGDILNPALSSFNAGVRGYYFALAAGAWLLGPEAFSVVTLGAVGLLVWRQSASRAAKGIRTWRRLIEDQGNDEAGSD